jgi:hypothetical protein
MVKNFNSRRERSLSCGKKFFPLIPKFFIFRLLAHIFYIMPGRERIRDPETNG